MSMKKILTLSALLALGLLGIVMATPGPNHKILWCHFPPGQWSGDPATSKALILSIDVAADGTPQGGQHLNHQGDGPVSVLGLNCGGQEACNPGTAIWYQSGGTIQIIVNLVPGTCVCPEPTPNAGSAPTGSPLNCGITG